MCPQLYSTLTASTTEEIFMRQMGHVLRRREHLRQSASCPHGTSTVCGCQQVVSPHAKLVKI